MKLSELGKILECDFNGPDVTFTQVCTDTRAIQQGDLFVALQGENFDGHHFLETARQAGAVAALISHPQQIDFPTICVKNTRLALGKLAFHHRQKMSACVVAVTGSCGKTTTRALLENIFQCAGETIASPASFNNDIGVPITLLKIKPQHRYVISELGANHAGEIAYLTDLVRPNIAIITNAAAAHLEGFGSLDGVANAKGEIFQGLNENGIAIVNVDDQYAPLWLKLIGSHKVITFGKSEQANIRASEICSDENGQANFYLHTFSEKIFIQMTLLGHHNVMNALAASAAAIAGGLTIQHIKQGLERTQAVDRRLIPIIGHRGARIIDDSYNANPQSVIAAMHVLKQFPGKSIFVFGDMLELGPVSEKWHKQIGEIAKKIGIDQIYCYGNLSKQTVNGFGKNGQHFTDLKKLIEILTETVNDQTVLLIKGSRGMKMEEITRALEAK